LKTRSHEEKHRRPELQNEVSRRVTPIDPYLYPGLTDLVATREHQSIPDKASFGFSTFSPFLS